ncbi:hypothetical protein L4D06_01535 [Enterovibrio makurazakiensis]|uniref:hypothetical protein n=1 Tax=Enterovibrio makurazakiensis TaxID=2910232 RepID=UPI003D1CF058
MKNTVLTALIVCTSLGVLVFASTQLHNSLYRLAARNLIENLQQRNVETFESQLFQQLSSSLINTPCANAHDYTTSAKLSQWNAFLNTSLTTDRTKFLLEKSTWLRPTWSPSYSELASLNGESHKNRSKQELLLLSSKFGPYRPSTKLAQINFGFSNWELLEQDFRLLSLQNLLSISSVWRYRPALNQMIIYSKGKRRICNLLTFNQIQVEACG